MNNKSKFKKEIFDYYLQSRDFNGLPIESLYEKTSLNKNEFHNLLIELIKDRSIDIVYEGDIPNPHIKPFPANSVSDQIKKILELDNDCDLYKHKEKENFLNFMPGAGVCLYPSVCFLKKNANWINYAKKPFTLRLAKGECQLKPYFFDLGILAVYRNDPRYRYQTDNSTGSILVSNDDMPDSDKIFIEHFGFGFNDKGRRFVSVLLTDLSKMTEEHQQIWNSKVCSDRYLYKLHPDFRKSILGYFPDKISIYSAFIQEIKVINKMTNKIKKTDLFKNDFSNCEPENFGFLLLPTLREFELFCKTLDLMLSDNLNRNFFKRDLVTQENISEISSIRMLDMWLDQKVNMNDTRLKDELISSLKEIRKLRSDPSHSFVENKWNEKYFTEQKIIIKKAYSLVRTLRLIFSNHPNCKNVEISDNLFKGNITVF